MGEARRGTRTREDADPGQRAGHREGPGAGHRGLAKASAGQVLRGEDETNRYRLRLEGGLRRWETGGNPHTRYRFEVLGVDDLPVEGPS
jgi:hypothetical protein